jgi:hypothetical protein
MYLSIDPMPDIYRLGLVALSFVLAFLTWKFVETPVRTRGRRLLPKMVIALGCASMCISGVAGWVIYDMKGFERRISPDRLALVRGMTDRMPAARQCMNTSLAAISSGSFCALRTGKAPLDTIIWGDSFAEAVAPGIWAAAERANKPLLLVGQHGCSPQPKRQLAAMEWDTNCQQHNNAVLAGLDARNDIRSVVLVMRWPSAGSGDALQPIANGGNSAPVSGIEKFSSEIEELLKQLSSAGKTVWIVGPIPISKYHVPRALYVQSLGFDVGTEIRPQTRQYHAAFGWVATFLQQVKNVAPINIIELDKDLCDDRMCKVVDRSHPFYFDNNHLTVHGATFVSSRFDALFR